MDLAIKVFTLAATIRLLTATDKPWLCAAIYASVVLALKAMWGNDLASVAVMAGVAFVAAFVYFSILDRLDTSSITWWIVAVVGVPLVFL